MTPAHELGSMPDDRPMITVDEIVVHAPVETIFALAADVARWPAYLEHYRYVKFLETAPDGGGVVEMSANRPFGPLPWPTWWTSLMTVSRSRSIRFRHVHGVTTGMEVEWTFEALSTNEQPSTLVRIVHAWNGPPWPVIGVIAARLVIGPVFVHGIASRTLAGLRDVAERSRG